MSKGFFPPKFNTLENQNYSGKMPNEKYFVPDSMKPEQYAEFNKWYKEHKNYHFDLQVKLKKYCDLDVDILARRCRNLGDCFLRLVT